MIHKKHRLGTFSKHILLGGLNRFNGAPTSLGIGVTGEQRHLIQDNKVQIVKEQEVKYLNGTQET